MISRDKVDVSVVLVWNDSYSIGGKIWYSEQNKSDTYFLSAPFRILRSVLLPSFGELEICLFCAFCES